MELDELLTHLFDLHDKAEPEGWPSLIDQQTLKAIIIHLDILNLKLQQEALERGEI